MRILSILLIILCLLGSCSSVKDVLKSQEKTERVVTEWRKNNPLDTSKTRKEGAVVVVRDTTIHDSIPVPYPVNHRYTEIRYVNSLKVDTFYTRDTAMEGLLKRNLIATEKVLVVVTKDRDEWKAVARERLWILIALITLIVGGGVFWLIKTFQPKITIGK